MLQAHGPEAIYLQHGFPPGTKFALGANLAHRGEICTLGGMFTPFVHPQG
jgi:hypothetical protein